MDDIAMRSCCKLKKKSGNEFWFSKLGKNITLLILKPNFKVQILEDFWSKYTFSNLLRTHLYSPRNCSAITTKTAHYSVINYSVHKRLTQTTQNTYPATTHYSTHSLHVSPLYRVFNTAYLSRQNSRYEIPVK